MTHDLGAVEVYSITRMENRTVTSTWKGFIALGFRTIGQQFSPDHKKLFVTSEINGTATSLNQTGGLISVLDVATLRVTPGKSLVKKVPGGCHPVRSTMSLDGKQLWVTARESNQVLAFDAEKLADNTTMNPLLAQLDTGTSPLGITAIKNHIFTADSNRWDYNGTTTGVTVVNVGGALHKGLVNFPQIPTGAFPRTLVASPSGNTLLISEFAASNIRAVDISSLNES
jgi:DNA-binding beta-propeller fold protein YncE